MRAYVAGATGLHGNDMVRHLRSRGHELAGRIHPLDKARWTSTTRSP
jgi:hypothetical protein